MSCRCDEADLDADEEPIKWSYPDSWRDEMHLEHIERLEHIPSLG